MNSSPSTSPLSLRNVNASVALQIVSGPHEGEERRFKSFTKLVVGRGRDAQWRLHNDIYLGRNHFQVEMSPPSCSLLDLGSPNGTRVNGARIQEEVHLKNGDRIECGDTVFVVSISLGPDQADTPTLVVPPDKRIDPATIPPPDAFPRRIAEFELTRELGRGGMGIVYHAIQHPGGREAAVKTILPTALVTAEAIQLFLREASTLAQLRHRRIVECIGLGLDAGEMYLAMEYLPVINFQQFLAKQTRAKQIRLACDTICRVLEALQYAHELDIVHRDVKPSNMLIYKKDGRLQVKLGDFGLAKNYANAGFTVISCENQRRYTYAYAAPEQRKNSRYAKPPCDIYSTGASLYVFLSNKLPFAPTDAATGSSPLSEPIPLAIRAPDVPQELAAIVDRSLAMNPTDRFSSAEHMRRALLKFTQK